MMRISTKKVLILVLLFLSTSNNIFSQFNWNTIDDSVSLNPNLYLLNGSATISGLGKVITDDNKIYLDFKNKNIYLNNFNNVYKFPFDQVLYIFISEGEEFSGKTFFESEFKEKTIKSHRKKLFNSLLLNNVLFTYSKKNKLDVSKDGKLFVKNEKLKTGKICAVGLDFVVILTEEGDLLNMSDGDFNSLSFDNNKVKDCKTLYNIVFSYFQSELEKRVDRWEQDILSMDITRLLNKFGPLNISKDITSEIKQLEWEWPIITYQVNLSTAVRQFGLGDFMRRTTFTSNAISSIYGDIAGSSIFMYGNSNRTGSIESSMSGLNTTITNTSQNGKITMLNEGAKVSIVKDKFGKSIILNHKNIFSDLNYGSPFKFIEY
jgi:hypothetical protein